MNNRKKLFGIILTGIILFMSLLTTTQVTGTADPTKVVTWGVVRENLVVNYIVAEFETPDGATEGEVALGYNPFELNTPFWGENISIAQGDTLKLKIDTRNDKWENETGDSSIIVEPWIHYFLGWAPVQGTLGGGTNASLIHDGSAQWITQILLRCALLSKSHKIPYKPYDAVDPTKYDNYFVSTLGNATDNGTIYPGHWVGSSDIHNGTFEVDSTYHMRGDAGGIKNKVYNKIPATWNGTTATWNYSYTMYGYTDGGYYGIQLSRCYDYGKGWEDPRPFFTVVTDNTTGIANSIEFDFSFTSAWKYVDDDGHTFWNLTGNGPDIAHPLTTQVAKLKFVILRCPCVDTGDVFGIVSIVTIASIAVLAVFINRRRK
ncbi:MAG: hypothetical protein ACFFC7_24460 [Candidatus Hermodarchaeota archaeon]